MVKALELAITKAANLPEAAQEQLGRELLERIDGLAGDADGVDEDSDAQDGETGAPPADDAPDDA